MSLPNILTVAPTEDGWKDFWFNNWIEHQEICQQIQASTNTAVPPAPNNGINNTVYIITPWVDEDANGILQRHQEYHDDMNLALGLQGQDLSVVNFDNPTSLRDWVWNHYLEHQAVHQTLDF